MEEIQSQVVKIISEVLNVPSEIITADLSIGDIPEWDSMGNLAVIARLESELGIDFPVEDLMDLTSVRSIVDRISQLRK